MWKNLQMEKTFEAQLNGAKYSQFNGRIVYESNERALEAQLELRPALDAEYDFTVVENALAVEADGEYGCSHGRLEATDFMQAVITSKPLSAEFEAVDEDGEQYQMNLVDGQWVLLKRSGTYQEVS